MYIYLLIILISFLLFLLSYNHPNQIIYKFYFIIVALVICFGYTTGGDWRAYETIYGMSQRPDYWLNIITFEPGYLALNYIGYLLHLDFWIWYIAIKLLLYFKICQIIQRFTPSRLVLLAFTFYLGFWGILNFMDSSFRNMIAAFVFMCSINTILNRQFFKYLIYCLIAILFHYSAIILILFYPLLTKRFTNTQIIIAYIGINIVVTTSDIIFPLLQSVFAGYDPILTKIERYSSGGEEDFMGEGKILSFGFFFHTCILLLLIYKRKSIEQIKYGNFIFAISTLFPFVFRIGLSMLIFSRFQLFIGCFYSIGVACCILGMKTYKLGYSTLLFLVSTLSLSGQMKDEKFVPYTNYILNVGNNWSFSFRDTYNHIHSPYKKSITNN